MKRIIAFALVTCLLVAAFPAAFAFTDVKDKEINAAAEMMKNLGLMTPYDDGTFRPDLTLTRAMFCTYAARLSDPAVDEKKYRSFTKFPDVRISHWGIGWVNAAVSLKLLTGFPDGTFQPDAAIQYGMVISVLMHVLKYTDEDVGANWPFSYIDAADRIGLTKGVSVSNYKEAITRGTAARLINNALRLKVNKTETTLLAAMGVVSKEVLILSIDSIADDGTSKGILLSDGTSVPYTFTPDSSMVFTKGTAIFDSNKRMTGFVPGAGTKKAVSMYNNDSTSITDADGTVYDILDTTSIFEGTTSSAYKDVWVEFNRGELLELHFKPNGTIDYIVRLLGGTTAKVVVLPQTLSSDPILTAFGSGAKSAVIYKNGVVSAVGDLAPWDVLEYYASSKIILASNAHFTAAIGKKTMSASATTVTFFDEVYQLSEKAINKLSDYTVGKVVSVLLGSGNVIADIVPVMSADFRTPALLTKADGAEITLVTQFGKTIKGKNSEKYNVGRMVNFFQSGIGGINVSYIDTVAEVGSVDLTKMTVGGRTIASYCTFYEGVTNKGVLREVSKSSLPTVIDSSKVMHVEVGANGKVETLILDDVTGDSYIYGKFSYSIGQSYSEFGTVYNTYSATLNGKNYDCPILENPPSNGSVAGVAVSLEFGNNSIVKVVKAVSIGQVTRFDFDGVTSVTVGDTTYAIADNIMVYNEAGTIAVDLAEAKKTVTRYTIYTDIEKTKVRYIVGT